VPPDWVTTCNAAITWARSSKTTPRCPHRSRRAEAPTRRPEGGVSALDDDPGAAERRPRHERVAAPIDACDGREPTPRASEDLPRLNRPRRGRTATAMLVPDTYAPTAGPSSAIATDESSPRPMR
jgi:hypothetical protein